MDDALRRIYVRFQPAHRTIVAQRDRLQTLAEQLQPTQEVSPALLARTMVAGYAVDGGLHARVVRDVVDGVGNAIVQLEVAAAEVTSCLTLSRRHASFDAALNAALLPNFVPMDEVACARLLGLQLPNPIPEPELPYIFVRVEIVFTALHLLLDHQLPKTLEHLGRVGVYPPHAHTVQQARIMLNQALLLANLIVANAQAILYYCAGQHAVAVWLGDMHGGGSDE